MHNRRNTLDATVDGSNKKSAKGRKANGVVVLCLSLISTFKNVYM